MVPTIKMEHWVTAFDRIFKGAITGQVEKIKADCFLVASTILLDEHGAGWLNDKVWELSVATGRNDTSADDDTLMGDNSRRVRIMSFCMLSCARVMRHCNIAIAKGQYRAIT